jgi:hypothetical protein
VLACLRLTATEATTPHALEEWHRYALPAFTARMGERLGIGCPPGRHTDWPARAWAAEYDSSRVAEGRRALFDGDAGPRRAAGIRRSWGAPGATP